MVLLNDLPSFFLPYQVFFCSGNLQRIARQRKRLGNDVSYNEIWLAFFCVTPRTRHSHRQGHTLNVTGLQNVIQFHSMSKCNFIYARKKVQPFACTHVPGTDEFSTALCTEVLHAYEFHPNQTINVGSMDRN
jgi:hypothetical protein